MAHQVLEEYNSLPTSLQHKPQTGCQKTVETT